MWSRSSHTFGDGQNVRTNFFTFGLTLALLTWASLAFADSKESIPPWQATISVSPLEPNIVHVGEVIDVIVSINHPLDTMVLSPDKLGSSRWTHVSSTQLTSQFESGLRTQITLKFGMFRPGETTLRSHDFTVIDHADNAMRLQTPELSLKVISALEDDNRGFTAPLPLVPVWTKDYTFAWLAGIGFAGLFGVFLGLFWMRRQKLEIEEFVPDRPAHEVALEKLSALAGDKLVEDGLHMIFYVRMSEAIREYLGRRYGFPGTELTTTEILARLAHVDWPRGINTDEVRKILEHSDLVKFGGFIPGHEQAHETLRRCFTVVELTKIILTPTAQSEDSQEGEA